MRGGGQWLRGTSSRWICLGGVLSQRVKAHDALAARGTAKVIHKLVKYTFGTLVLDS